MSITEQPSEAVADRPYPDLLSKTERKVLLLRAEHLWRNLQANELGGYSGDNRPFWILHEFKSIIEMFGRRDVGLSWSKDDLDAAALSMKAAEQPRTDDFPSRDLMKRAWAAGVSSPPVDQGVVERVTAKQIDQIVTETMNETFANAYGGGRFSMNAIIRSAVCKALAAISPQLGEK